MLDIPRDLDARFEIIKRASEDAEFRQRVIERAREDAKFFINTFAWGYDPRETVPIAERVTPFILYDFQEEVIDWLDARLASGEDGVIDKSRDMGATWCFLLWALHKWLFRPGTQGLLGSRVEDKVDNRTMDSHFGKLEFAIDWLPGWLKPQGYQSGKHRMHCKLINPENGNVLSGESANAQFSRQGRYTFVFFDEAAFWENLASAWRAAGMATTTRLGISTPEGMNTWGRLVHSGKIPHKRLHWSLHPKHDDAWYQAQCARLVFPEDIAQELEISYSRSVRGVVYPNWHDVPKGNYPWVEGWALYVSWDFGLADDTAIIWWARNPETGKLRMIDAYKNNGVPIDFYVPFITGMIPEAIAAKYTYTPEELQKIAEHALYPPAIHFGDPAGDQRNLVTGTSVIDELRRHHIFVFTNRRANDFKSRRQATQLGLSELEGVNLPACEEVDEAMQNSRFPARPEDSRSTAEITKPIHDRHSHFRTAVEYLFVNLPPLVRMRRPATERRAMAYDQAFR